MKDQKHHTQGEQPSSHIKLNKIEKLEQQIINEFRIKNPLSPIQQTMKNDLSKRIEKYEREGQRRTGSEKVQCLVAALVYSKMAVRNYGESNFVIVRSQVKLAEAYGENGFLEQALEHEISAVNILDKLEDFPHKQIYRGYIHSRLAHHLYTQNKVDRAESLLAKIFQNLSKYNSTYSEYIRNQAKILLALIDAKKGNFDTAIQVINEVILNIQNSEEDKSLQIVEALGQKAFILSIQDDYDSAAKYLEEVISLISETGNIKQMKESKVNVHQKLGDYYKKLDQNEKSLKNYQLSLKFMENSKVISKQFIRVKRKFAIALLKNGNNKSAIEELEEIVSMEEKFYGGISVQIARTLKLLGSIKIDKKNEKGVDNIKKSLKIFSFHGLKNQIQECKSHLRTFLNNKNVLDGINLDLQYEI